MCGGDSRRQPKIFSLLPFDDPLTRIHSNPHLRQREPPPLKTGQREKREAIGFSFTSA